MTSPIVVNFGGGVNSTAMLAGMVERGMRFDLVVFADTGGERPETYEHVAAVSRWLEHEADRDPIHVVRWIRQDGRFVSLEDACIEQKMLPSLAYGFKGCSVKWKAQPIDKYVREKFADTLASGHKITRCIGFDLDEAHRVKDRESDEWTFAYPLVDWGWDRAECHRAIKRVGLPMAAKSSCFFCPAMRLHEIQDLRRSHPALFDRAVAMEQNAELTTVKGLGRNWAWSDAVKADDAQGKLFAPEIACECYDGDAARAQMERQDG